MLKEEQFFEKIQRHLDSKLPFVVYKKPNGKRINAILQSTQKIYTTENFKEQGFVFAPFDDKEETILLPLDTFLTTQPDKLSIKTPTLSKNNKNNYSENERESYKTLIEKAKHSIQEKLFEKVVLSRIETIPIGVSDIISVFKKMSKTYASAFVYGWYHPKIGTWLGATPETLLHLEENKFSTMSLAGTQMYKEEGVEWSKKELREQQIVTNTIIYNLNKIKNITTIQISDIESVKAGNLVHLKTVIRGCLESVNPKKTIRALHPTPAVCGFPTAKAKEFILKNENYHRAYYTGFLGELNMRPHTDSTISSHLFVNLRCMEVKKDKVFLYVGGGITAESNSTLEWEETVNKTQTMKKVLFTLS